MSSATRLSNWLQSAIGRQPADDAASAGDSDSLPVHRLPSIEQVVARHGGLPQGLLRLLLPGPVSDPDLLVGRETHLERLDDALREWQAGEPTSVVLVGPQGCGQTSLVQCFRQRVPPPITIVEERIDRRLENEAHVLAFCARIFGIDPAPTDVEDLVVRVSALAPRAVLLDAGHNLLLRVIGGLRAAEAFLYTVLRTRRRHFWLVACRRHPWNEIDRCLDGAQYFSRVMALDRISADQLRDALLERLKKSGLRVEYVSSREEAGATPPTGEDTDSKAQTTVHRALAAHSGCNVSAALYLLLLCSRYTPATGTLSLWPPPRLDNLVVKDLPLRHKLTLAELAAHGELSLTEHRRIFREEEIRSRSIFERLEQLRLVEGVTRRGPDDAPRWELSPVVHRAVTETLEQMNLLY